LPSFAEELARMQWLKANNKVSDDERCKLVFPRIEAKKRVKNVEGRTKLIIQLDTAETYSEFSAQFARYKEMTGNPQLAFELMLSLLRAPSDESLRRYAEGAKT
jgi:FPC/CPF motif-containing protein YcgG